MSSVENDTSKDDKYDREVKTERFHDPYLQKLKIAVEKRVPSRYIYGRYEKKNADGDELSFKYENLYEQIITEFEKRKPAKGKPYKKTVIWDINNEINVINLPVEDVIYCLLRNNLYLDEKEKSREKRFPSDYEEANRLYENFVLSNCEERERLTIKSKQKNIEISQPDPTYDEELVEDPSKRIHELKMKKNRDQMKERKREKLVKYNHWLDEFNSQMCLEKETSTKGSFLVGKINKIDSGVKVFDNPTYEYHLNFNRNLSDGNKPGKLPREYGPRIFYDFQPNVHCPLMSFLDNDNVFHLKCLKGAESMLEKLELLFRAEVISQRNSFRVVVFLHEGDELSSEQFYDPRIYENKTVSKFSHFTYLFEEQEVEIAEEASEEEVEVFQTGYLIGKSPLSFIDDVMYNISQSFSNFRIYDVKKNVLKSSELRLSHEKLNLDFGTFPFFLFFAPEFSKFIHIKEEAKPYFATETKTFYFNFYDTDKYREEGFRERKLPGDPSLELVGTDSTNVVQDYRPDMKFSFASVLTEKNLRFTVPTINDESIYYSAIDYLSRVITMLSSNISNVNAGKSSISRVQSLIKKCNSTMSRTGATNKKSENRLNSLRNCSANYQKESTEGTKCSGKKLPEVIVNLEDWKEKHVNHSFQRLGKCNIGCPNPDFPKLSGKDPNQPCCSKTGNVYTGETSGKLSYLKKTLGKLDIGAKASVPPSISALIKKLLEESASHRDTLGKPGVEVKRVGVKADKFSFLRASFLAMEKSKELNGLDKEDGVALRKIWAKINAKIHEGTMAQELTGVFCPKKIPDDVNVYFDDYFDPNEFYRALETYLECNVLWINNFEFVRPTNKKYYNRQFHFSKTIFLVEIPEKRSIFKYQPLFLEHPGKKAVYTFEIPVASLYKKMSTVKYLNFLPISFDIKREGTEDGYNIFNKINAFSFQPNNRVGGAFQYFPSLLRERGMEVVWQQLDGNGKVQMLEIGAKLLGKSEAQKFHVYTPRLAPLNVKTYSEGDDMSIEVIRNNLPDTLKFFGKLLDENGNYNNTVKKIGEYIYSFVVDPGDDNIVTGINFRFYELEEGLCFPIISKTDTEIKRYTLGDIREVMKLHGVKCIRKAKFSPLHPQFGKTHFQSFVEKKKELDKFLNIIVYLFLGFLEFHRNILKKKHNVFTLGDFFDNTFVVVEGKEPSYEFRDSGSLNQFFPSFDQIKRKYNIAKKRENSQNLFTNEYELCKHYFLRYNAQISFHDEKKNQYKFKLHNKKFKTNIEIWFKKFYETYLKSKKYDISDYNHIKDYYDITQKQQEHAYTIIGNNDLRMWKYQRKIYHNYGPDEVYEYFTRNVARNIFPVFFKHEEMIYIIQNTFTGTKTNAVELAFNWSKEKINLGYNERKAVSQEDVKSKILAIYGIHEGKLLLDHFQRLVRNRFVPWKDGEDLVNEVITDENSLLRLIEFEQKVGEDEDKIVRESWFGCMLPLCRYNPEKESAPKIPEAEKKDGREESSDEESPEEKKRLLKAGKREIREEGYESEEDERDGSSDEESPEQKRKRLQKAGKREIREEGYESEDEEYESEDESSEKKPVKKKAVKRKQVKQNKGNPPQKSGSKLTKSSKKTKKR